MSTESIAGEASRKPRRLRPATAMITWGVVILWMTMVAPVTMLISWLLGQPAGLWLLASLPFGPLAALLFRRTVQSASLRLRWPVMQYLGWGAALMPLCIIGAIATLWLPERTVGVAVLLAWLIVGSLGVLAATKIQERRLRFAHPALDRRYRVIQLSDIHVGSRRPSFLRKALNQALRHQPDVILITGDLIDASVIQADDLASLAEVDCPLYVSLGNHERYIDLEISAAKIAAQGAILLRGQTAIFGRLQFIGLDDSDDPDFLAAALPGLEIKKDHYRILLYHRPHGWDAAKEAAIDLMLSGHTHGGQIWPFHLFVKGHFEHHAGLFSDHGRHLYVSVGTGCWGPIMRIGTRAEMTLIDLEPAA